MHWQNQELEQESIAVDKGFLSLSVAFHLWPLISIKQSLMDEIKWVR